MHNSIKDMVLEAADIVDVIGRRVQLARKGSEFVGLCPFHPDHKPSMSVSPKLRIFKCWSCGAGGDVIRFVERIDGVDFRTALRNLADQYNIHVDSPSERRNAAARDQVRAAVAWAAQHFRRNLADPRLGQVAREYAARRGLRDSTVERFGLGCAAPGWDDVLTAGRRARLTPEALQTAGLLATNEQGRTYDRFRNRLIFPIWDATGRPIAFGGRALADDPAKYLNSPETVLFSKSRVLYGLHLAGSAMREQKSLIVVEGYLDAVMLAQAGFQHVVAVLGTALTDAHIKLIAPHIRRLYLCFDNDAAGQRAVDRAVDVALRTDLDVRVVEVSGGKDPADCVVSGGAAAFEHCLSTARDALEFKWQQTLGMFGGGSVRARRLAIESLLEFLARVSTTGGLDPLRQNLFVSRLAELVGLPADEILDLLKRTRRQQRHVDAAPLPSEDLSDYEASVRGLSERLTAAVECVLGLLVRRPSLWAGITDSLARAVSLSETWGRLYAVLLDAREEMGEYSFQSVLARCADGALCDLLGRATARVGHDVTETTEGFGAALEALDSELRLLEMGELRHRAGPGAGEAPAGEAFDELRRLARQEHGNAPVRENVLGMERRWRLSASVSAGGTRGEVA